MKTTVEEMIEKLNKFPKDYVVAVEIKADGVEYWSDIDEIYGSGEKVFLFGDFGTTDPESEV